MGWSFWRAENEDLKDKVISNREKVRHWYSWDNPPRSEVKHNPIPP